MGTVSNFKHSMAIERSDSTPRRGGREVNKIILRRISTTFGPYTTCIRNSFPVLHSCSAPHAYLHVVTALVRGVQVAPL